jgi:uncharacterized protein (DUF1697 family)
MNRDHSRKNRNHDSLTELLARVIRDHDEKIRDLPPITLGVLRLSSGTSMPVFIALIRGINVGGHKKIKMADVKRLCEELGLSDVRTHLQSGNVVFRTARTDRARLVKEVEDALALDARVILRNAAELRKAMEANPMPEEAQGAPSAFVVVFLGEKPSAAAMQSLRDAYSGPEKMELHGAELYIHYGAGMGTSKLTNTLIERKLGTSGTARNWNTVTRLVEMAEEK